MNSNINTFLNSTERTYIAYFSMEIGISHKIPTYSGGLGILAGDLLKSFADMKVPIIGITLLNEKGYFNQKIDFYGNQIENSVDWNPSEFMVLLPNQIMLNIEGRNVTIRVWKHMINGLTGTSIPIYFLDTNIEQNSAYDRTLTSHLYGGDSAYRIAQEMILGIGGVRLLDSLGYNIKKYHLNEGHASLLSVELYKKLIQANESLDEQKVIDLVKNKCVFTTHTPVAAGHDTFEIELFNRITNNYIPKQILYKVCQDNKINMTMIALYFSKYVNGVAKRHGEVTREMFPNYSIESITNGIHPATWVSPHFKKLFDEYVPGWFIDPFSLRYALNIPKEKIWKAHIESKNELIEEINKRTGIGFHPARFTLGFARRFTSYKRPDLILYDLNKLKHVANIVGDIQIVFAGKAHSRDTLGKELIKKIFNLCKEINSENGKLKMVFLEDYDMSLSRKMISGCDAWLNTPQRPFEASGTSGMKASLNGVPNISTLDGWWVEGCIDNITGWGIGPHPQDPNFKNDPDMTDEAIDLYNKLETIIIPTFYGNSDKWIDIMRHTIAINASFFNTYRMAQQYIVNAYQN